MPHKTLTHPQDVAEIRRRVDQLRSDSARCWGKMNAHQALCHLSDSFLLVMGEKNTTRRPVPVLGKLVRRLALDVPLRWPKGYGTVPELDQLIGGTRPTEFERDRQTLRNLFERFLASPRDFQFAPHPFFGEMSEADWLRWGYLHMDHHLRQFGV